MPQVINIAVELDDSGAVQSTRNIEGSLQKVGQKGNVVFTGLAKDQQRAHAATSLFVRTLGVEMPQALEKVIAKSELIGPIMATAFKATVVLAVISALVALVPKIESAAKALGGYTQEMQDFNAANIKANADTLVSGRTVAIARENLENINKSIVAKEKYVALLEKDNTLWGLLIGPSREVKATDESLADTKKDLVLLAQQQVAAAEQLARKEAEIAAILEGKATSAAMAGLTGFGALAEKRRQDNLTADKLETSDHAAALTLRQLADVEYSRSAGALARQLADETRKVENQAVLSTLEGKQKLVAAEIQFDRETEILVKRGELGRADADRRILAFHKQTQEGIRQEDQKTADQEFAELQAIAAFSKKETDAMADQNTQRALNHVEVLNTIKRAEREAAIAIAEANGDTATAIRLQEQQRVDDALAGLARLDGATEESTRVRVALEQTANARIVQENRSMVNTLGDQLLSIWDDIANGNIGKTILNLFKKLIAQMVAQWLLGIGMMKNAFVSGQQSGTGILGGLMSSLFGLGGGGGGLLGGAGGGVAQSGSGGMFNVGLGGPGIVGAGGGIVGFGSGPGAAQLSSGGGTAGMATQQAGASGLLAKLLPGVFGKGGFLGQGGTVGKFMTAHPMLTGSMFAGVGGFLTGLGSGSMATGALSGALTGLMMGGPIGALVGAVAGVLGGLIGGGQKKDAAVRAAAQFNQPLHQTLDDYKNFKLEYAAALAQLQAIEGQAEGAMAQFGPSAGRTGLSHVRHEYAIARKQIMDIERDRAQRRNVDPGLPEFSGGGEFVARTRGGPGLAVLHDEEYVMNPAASRRYRPVLEAMNAGGSPAGAGGGMVQISVNTVSPRSFRDWLRDGGVEEIRAALAGDRMNYQGA